MWNIILNERYLTIEEIRLEIQNRLNGNKSNIDNFDLRESLNIALKNKKDNLKLLCWYDFLIDAIKEGDTQEVKRYAKRLDFHY